MKYIFTIIVCFIAITIQCQESLQKKLNELYNQPFYKHANLGVSVRDVANGITLAAISKDKMMIPASTLKIITTMVAHKKFGPNYRYETIISYDGSIGNDGTLHGNIYIKGSGDPTLGGGRIIGNPSLKEWENKIVESIRLAGIHCVEGDIISIIRSDNAPPLGDSWQWHDLGNYYASGSYPLNVNENLYNVYFSRNFELNELAKISYIEPYIPHLQINSWVTLDSTFAEDKSYIFGIPYTYQRDIRGSIPKGKTLFRIKGAIPDPPLFLAYRLHNALEQHHISGSHYKTQKENNIPAVLQPIAKHYSPALSEIIKYANESSINLYTDALLDLIGQSQIVKENAGILKSVLRNEGFDVQPVHLEDGSGLSARNLISADFMSDFLYRQIKNQDKNKISELLPTVGINGTVKTLLQKSPAKGKMWVKSGSMDKVLTYAGYGQTASGKFVSFSIMLNGSTAKNMRENKIELEKILDAIYRFS